MAETKNKKDELTTHKAYQHELQVW